MEIDRSRCGRRRRPSDEIDAARPKLKRRQTDTGSNNIIQSALDGRYWAPLKLPKSSETPKKKHLWDKVDTPTKEIRSKLERIEIGSRAHSNESFEIETEDFQLPDEQDSSDDEDDESSHLDAFASLPVRYLDKFTFFDEKKQEMIGLDYLEEPDSDDDISPYFTGRVIARNVRPQGDDEEGNYSDDSTPEVPSVMLRSSSVLTVWESEEPEEDGIVSENSDIWVRTSYAWYILDRPAPQYREKYLPRWLHHKLYILVLHLLKGPSPTVSLLERHFLRNEAKWARYEFERELTLEDLRKRMPEVLQTLKEYSYDLHYFSFFDELCAKYDADFKSHSPHTNKRRQTQAQPPIRPKDVRLTPTFCTDFIRGIAQPYFPSLRRRHANSSLDSDSQGDQSSSVESLSWPTVPDGKPEIPRGERIQPGSDELSWIKMWGRKYRVGDVVMMQHEDTPDSLKGDPLDCFWFGLVLKLFCEQSSVDSKELLFKAHVLWFVPAGHSSLNRLAHPRELVVIDKCDEVDVGSFVAVCQLRKLELEEQEPELGDSSPTFFYRYLWLEDSANDDAFIDPNKFLKKISFHPSPFDCPSCRSADKAERAITPRESKHGIIFKHVEYHLHDTVYVVPDQPGDVYIVGQITQLTQQYVLLQQFHRGQRNEGENEFYNDRLLTFDHRSKPLKFDIDRLEGKCVVLPYLPPPFSITEVVFYLKTKAKMPSCCFCSNSPHPSLVHGTPLMGLDLFSGAGGLSIGLESTGCIKTGWAVEFDVSASRTFSEIHPHCIVYNACLNRLLHHMQDVRRGIKVKPVRSLDTQEDLPPFPVEGSVDIVFGGPPCQGFSRLNRCPRADDPRNHLILAFLSSVEILKPKYVLLENVRGILTFRLGAHQVGLTRVEGGIPGGMVMFIKRVLMGLNYQVRHGVLQAGHYGSPQVRRRVIFVASKRGIPLPDMPQPTHLAINSQNLGVKVIAKEGYNFNVNKRSKQAAPLGHVTVMDAIGDLPRWEWRNPHLISRQTHQVKSLEKRRAQHVLTISGAQTPPSVDIRASGLSDPMLYESLPTNLYQLQSRGSENEVSQHYTPVLNSKLVERVCSIPLTPKDKSKRFADHDDLPEELRNWGRNQGYYSGGYGRLEADGAFATALGTITPDTNGSQVIHPTQNRIITIREFARSQGFPDYVKFHHASNNMKQITKQIGNAVPVQMAAALGREIVKAESRLRQMQEKSARAKRETSFEL